MIRILLADDEHLIRGALAQMLDLDDDFEVVAQAATGPEAVAAARHHRPDVAVLDLQMPGLDGIEAAAEILTDLPQCGCVIVTSHGRPGYLKRAGTPHCNRCRWRWTRAGGSTTVRGRCWCICGPQPMCRWCSSASMPPNLPRFTMPWGRGWRP